MTRPRLPLPSRRWRGPIALIALGAASVAFGGLALPLLATDASPELLTAKPAAKTVRIVRTHDGSLCHLHLREAGPSPLTRPADR